MDKKLIYKIIACLKQYGVKIVMSLVCAFICVIGGLAIPVIIGKTIDYIICTDNVYFDVVIRNLIIVLVIALAITLLQWTMNTLNNNVAFSVIRDLRLKAFKKIQKLPMSYFDDHEKGEIVSRIISDVDVFADGLLLGFTQLFTGVITIACTLIFMISINFWIALVVVCITPLSFVIANFIAKKTFKMFSSQSKARADQTAFIDEMIGNLKTVNAYNQQSNNNRKFSLLNDDLKNVSLKAIFYSSITNPSTRFVNSIVYVCVTLFGSLLCIKSNEQLLSVGVLVCFLSYASQYTKPFNEISGVITEIQNAFACSKRIFDLIDEEQIKENENSIGLDNCKGNFEISDVDFSYDGKSRVINNVSVNIKQGQKIALVGPTGCGKTTLINLLMKFYDPDNGKILIDGIDYSCLKTKSLRRNVDMVLQDTWLKTGTIRDNIIISNRFATDEEIISASKKAHSYSFISKLPDGFDTAITDNGASLSQGQRQLICITRLMLSKSSVLILDEATSSIDTITEIKIQKAFKNLMENKTTFIVAHRLATVKDADLILVMDKGEIVEAGTHVELICKDGLYSSIYNSQYIK